MMLFLKEIEEKSVVEKIILAYSAMHRLLPSKGNCGVKAQ